MDDLISRQAALDVLEWFDQTDPLGHTPAQIVRALPTAEPKRGRWEMKPDPYEFFDEIPVCSECGCITKWREKYPYCPTCGAKMEGEE